MGGHIQQCSGAQGLFPTLLTGTLDSAGGPWSAGNWTQTSHMHNMCSAFYYFPIPQEKTFQKKKKKGEGLGRVQRARGRCFACESPRFNPTHLVCPQTSFKNVYAIKGMHSKNLFKWSIWGGGAVWLWVLLVFLSTKFSEGCKKKTLPPKNFLYNSYNKWIYWMDRQFHITFFSLYNNQETTETNVPGEWFPVCSI